MKNYIKKYKTKEFFKLYFVKFKMYEHLYLRKKFDENTFNKNLNKIFLGFKRFLQIIFNYNKKNKHILFIGFPYKLEFKINKLTKHFASSNHKHIYQLILNKNKIPIIFSSNYLSYKILKKKNFIDLIVTQKKENIFHLSKLNIPIISLDVFYSSNIFVTSLSFLFHSKYIVK